MNDLTKQMNNIVQSSVQHQYFCISYSKHEPVDSFEVCFYNEDGEDMKARLSECTDAFLDVGETIYEMSKEINELKSKLNKRWWKWWKN